MTTVSTTSRLSARIRALVESRPNSDDYGDDEPMELAVAVALGVSAKLSVKSLHKAIRRGRLASAEVARRTFVTKRALREMFEPKFVSLPTAALPAMATPKEEKREIGSAIESQLEWEHGAHRRKSTRRRRLAEEPQSPSCGNT